MPLTVVHFRGSSYLMRIAGMRASALMRCCNAMPHGPAKDNNKAHGLALNNEPLNFPIVGIGASVVGLKARSSQMPSECNIIRAMDTFLQAAIDEAQLGLAEGGIPIGSVLVHAGKILGRGHNRRVQSGDPVLHAEMDALRQAGRQPASVYRHCVIYTTLSPCAMCSGAILLYGIPKVVIGENRTFMGEEQWLRSRGVSLEVMHDPTCEQLMTRFITAQPTLWNEDIGE